MCRKGRAFGLFATRVHAHIDVHAQRHTHARVARTHNTHTRTHADANTHTRRTRHMNTHIHTHTHTHTHTHKHAHAHTRTHTHIHTHAHTHTTHQCAWSGRRTPPCPWPSTNPVGGEGKNEVRKWGHLKQNRRPKAGAFETKRRRTRRQKTGHLSPTSRFLWRGVRVN